MICVDVYKRQPLWLVKMFTKQYDYETAKKICIHDNTPPVRTARVNTLKTNKEVLLKEGCFKNGNLAPDALLYNAGNIAESTYYKEGLVTIQDESSQLVAPLLSPSEDDLVLDMCCAPGSKTCLLYTSHKLDNHGD